MAMSEKEEKKQSLEDRFPSNSYSKIEPKSPRVVAGSGEKKERVEVKENKRTLGERIIDSFVTTDKHEIGDHLIFDWLIPGSKKLAEDLFHMILYGSNNGDVVKRESGVTTVISSGYHDIFDSERSKRTTAVKPSRQPKFTFKNRKDAEDLLRTMAELVSGYGRASLKDFYNELFQISPTDFEMSRWGWYDLRDASVVSTSNGYLLTMPKVVIIDR